ncbi:Flap endonuclease GEN-like 1 [Holothuria leucospilota]|uniref:Flap endonuclease GEN homolog 1 n=1 Tax=Holothuria leucospilota TaxID=206669 RepID=A0A9Q1CNS0_HOLLE|nr:Flap endonuclease GEN-like 1 [Holothuria leucospilota]
MGVKELWTILSPAKKEVSLDTLTGQTIAVDLSVWICENQGVKAVQGKVSKPHLRNLFFRISNLIQLGITLVFVVDGDPPELKWETISNRINSRYKGRGRGSTKDYKIGKPGRSHFKRQIKECLELLDHLGVPYVQSKGEAEALCALLNQEGVVDGCITEDGDAFLYGATTVYRNFNLAGKNPVIDCYKMADIKRQLGLTREALVALALLLGCDYVPRGVPGVGKVHALQLISQFQGSNILEQFKRWANDDVEFQRK